MNDNGGQKLSEGSPKVAHCVIEFDLATGGFGVRMDNGIPLPMLVNALEMMKWKAISAQAQRAAEAEIVRQQSQIVLAHGSMPKK